MAAWIGPAIVAAVISSIVTALGWYVAHLQEVRREAGRRRERIVDVQVALLAEVRASHHRLRQVELQEHLAGIEARMAAASGGAFTPFVPREVPTFVFDALVSDIHVLPTAVIDPVVLYYRQIRAISQLAEDLRGERFERLETERKLDLYRDYVGLVIHAATLADEAVRLLAASIGSGRLVAGLRTCRAGNRLRPRIRTHMLPPPSSDMLPSAI
jgi:hypothetical protein